MAEGDQHERVQRVQQQQVAASPLAEPSAAAEQPPHGKQVEKNHRDVAKDGRKLVPYAAAPQQQRRKADGGAAEPDPAFPDARRAGVQQLAQRHEAHEEDEQPQPLLRRGIKERPQVPRIEIRQDIQGKGGDFFRNARQKRGPFRDFGRSKFTDALAPRQVFIHIRFSFSVFTPGIPTGLRAGSSAHGRGPSRSRSGWPWPCRS